MAFLKGQNKLKEAAAAYDKAIDIKPDYAEAYNNLGIALKGQSKLKEAAEAYNKAIGINPGFAEAWNNLYFSLQTMKLEISPDINLNLSYPKDIKSKYAKIELGILDYKLNRGQECEGSCLEKAISNLPLLIM